MKTELSAAIPAERTTTRVGGPAAPARVARPKVTAVALEKTPATRAEMRAAIDRAHRRLFGSEASAQTLDLLTAQASLETGTGTAMYNWNFGGIKGAGPTGKTALARTKEVLGGKTVEIRDGFRAYDSIDAGATDYVALLRDRFGGALDAARRGDLDGFAGKLKHAGYYTASETDYARALRALTGAAETRSATPHRGAVRTYATSEQLARVSDAVSAQDFSAPSPLGMGQPRKRRDDNDDDDA